MYTPRGKKSIHTETYPVPPIAHPPGQDGGGPEGVKQRLAAFREAFPELVADEEKANSRKPARPIYAASCMDIRPALQTAASPSDESADLLGWKGKMVPTRGIGRLR